MGRYYFSRLYRWLPSADLRTFLRWNHTQDPKKGYLYRQVLHTAS